MLSSKSCFTANEFPKEIVFVMQLTHILPFALRPFPKWQRSPPHLAQRYPASSRGPRPSSRWTTSTTLRLQPSGTATCAEGVVLASAVRLLWILTCLHVVESHPRRKCSNGLFMWIFFFCEKIGCYTCGNKHWTTFPVHTVHLSFASLIALLRCSFYYVFIYHIYLYGRFIASSFTPCATHCLYSHLFRRYSLYIKQLLSLSLSTILRHLSGGNFQAKKRHPTGGRYYLRT